MTGEKELKGILDFTECNQFILWMRKLREKEMTGVTQQPQPITQAETQTIRLITSCCADVAEQVF